MKTFVAFMIPGLLVAALLMGLKKQEVPPSGTVLIKESNLVTINLPIDDESVSVAQGQLMALNEELPSGEPLYLFLNSPGGSIASGGRLIETMQSLGRPVHSISLFSASMAFIISQYTNTRYVMNNSVMMSHRASLGGVEGQIPGNFFTRANFIMSQVTELEEDISKRAGYSMEEYRNLVENELWLTGSDAVNQHWADKKVKVRCDVSLSGYSDPIEVKVFIFTFKVQFPKCPMITAPRITQAEGDLEFKHAINDMLYNREQFVREYIKTGRIQKLLK